MRRWRLWRLAGHLRRRWVELPAGNPAEPQQLASEFSEAELREFLEGDLRGTPAAPEFQERLRRDLWSRLERSSARNRGERLD